MAASSIIRGRHIICRIATDGEVVSVDDGAIFQRDGRIVEIGPFDEIARRHHADETIGTGAEVVLPGMVNSHHHLGLTPLQHGVPDLPLELWLAARIGMRDVDPFLDTLYSAFEMIESGVTTVQHLHGRVPPPFEQIRASAKAVISAYELIGMRASYSYGIRDQNRLVYEDDDAFAARLPEPAAGMFREWIKTQRVPVEACIALFEELQAEHGTSERIRIQLAPVNLQWCSDDTLLAVGEVARRHGVPIHMHLVETRFQQDYAVRRTGRSAAAHLQHLGLLGPSLTLGHGVWLSPDDIDLLAETGTCVCHNASSNLRLQAGLAPLDALLAAGVRVGIGIDEAGINDDRDMLQELRLVTRLHRRPGHEASGPSAAQAFRMATEHGAHTTPFGATIGSLEVGKAADMSLVSIEEMAGPYLDDRVPLIDAVLFRARAGCVKTVMVAGEVILRDGVFTRVDKDAVLREFAERLSAPLTEGERARRVVSDALFPHVRSFYADHWNR